MTGTTASAHLLKLAAALFKDEVERQQFLDRLLRPKPLPSACVWIKDRNGAQIEAARLAPLPWQPEFVDRVSPGGVSGSSPLHQSGEIYLMDMSSVFALLPLIETGRERAWAEAVCDLCSAPGGKAILTWRALHPNTLVCNEVIGKRTAALISNLTRCSIAPVTVISRDSRILAEDFPGTFSIVLVDAPCSGQSLIAKGMSSPGCFHPAAINMNSNRQKRILANSARLVCPGGLLSYMTCTYSRQENEGVVEWFLKRFSEFRPVSVPVLGGFSSQLSDIPCYRLWPQSEMGAGAFSALFKKEGELTAQQLSLEQVRVFYQA